MKYFYFSLILFLLIGYIRIGIFLIEKDRQEEREMKEFFLELNKEHTWFISLRSEQEAYWEKLRSENRLDDDSILNCPTNLKDFIYWRDKREQEKSQ